MAIEFEPKDGLVANAISRALEPLISAVGSKDMSTALAHAVNVITRADRVYAFERRFDTKPILYSCWTRRGQLDDVVADYREHYYKTDPMNSTLRRASCEVASLKLKREDVPDRDYRRTCFDEPEICETLEVTGWGRTSEGGTTSETLQKASVPYVATATCNAPDAYGGKVRTGMLCAGFATGGVDACQGDSGGPLVLKRMDQPPVLIGVVGWGEGCARKLKYGVYTRVSAYRTWIDPIISADRN